MIAQILTSELLSVGKGVGIVIGIIIFILAVCFIDHLFLKKQGLAGRELGLKDKIRPSCKTCKYSARINPEVVLCRRNPPQFTPSGDVSDIYGCSEFPEVKETDWCGEYKNKNESYFSMGPK